MLKKQKKSGGFTLMEMLIVVAIIAVLVAIAIPTFTASLHKARVAADWANLRAYYAELQADLLTTGEYREDIPDMGSIDGLFTKTSITFLNGQQVKLQAGGYMVIKPSPTDNQDNGYQIHYVCNKYLNNKSNKEEYYKCQLILGASG